MTTAILEAPPEQLEEDLEPIKLSRREFEIFTMLGAGDRTTEISSKLELSEHTVRTHVKNAMRKSEATTRAHLCAMIGRGEVVGP